MPGKEQMPSFGASLKQFLHLCLANSSTFLLEFKFHFFRKATSDSPNSIRIPDYSLLQHPISSIILTILINYVINTVNSMRPETMPFLYSQCLVSTCSDCCVLDAQKVIVECGTYQSTKKINMNNLALNT